jgi:hypothetical protein
MFCAISTTSGGNNAWFKLRKREMAPVRVGDGYV